MWDIQLDEACLDEPIMNRQENVITFSSFTHHCVLFFDNPKGYRHSKQRQNLKIYQRTLFIIFV